MNTRKTLVAGDGVVGHRFVQAGGAGIGGGLVGLDRVRPVGLAR